MTSLSKFQGLTVNYGSVRADQNFEKMTTDKRVILQAQSTQITQIAIFIDWIEMFITKPNNINEKKLKNEYIFELFDFFDHTIQVFVFVEYLLTDLCVENHE